MGKLLTLISSKTLLDFVMSANAIFIGHGAPLVALDNDTYSKDLKKFAASIPKPDTIISVSAHWEQDIPINITSAPHPRQIYDFYGFPQQLFELNYRPQGNPKLAKEFINKLNKSNIKSVPNPDHGLDHGTWIPLSIMYPGAEIPTIQISIPKDHTPEFFVKMGNVLKQFRDRNILFMGSGNIVHNLRMVRGLSPADKNATPDEWAKEFDGWINENLESENLEQLYKYTDAPYSDYAVPTTEHFYPMFFTLGLKQDNERVEYITEEFHYRNISMRSFKLTS